MFPTPQEIQEQADRLAAAQQRASDAMGYRDPEQQRMSAFRTACDSGAVEQTAKLFRRDTLLQKINADLTKMGTLDIFEVQALLETLLAQCDGNTSVNLDECLENVKADALAVEAMQDEQDEAQLPVRLTAF